MSRVKFENVTNVTDETNDTLDTLIPAYAENKSELDSYKKICENENNKIKDLMLEQGLDTYTAGGYKVTRSVAVKETFNEDALMQVIKANCKDSSIIKTKEYVDMDALEKAIYNGEISKDVLLEMDKCKEIKETVMLRLTKQKGEKKDA